MNGLSHVGTIYALYVDTNYIERFETIDDATRFAKKHYHGLDFFVKPLTYFGYDRMIEK
uniref:Uncharacterized protein n=1 Tax=viral metagenome TaxID=1070528 RepID=A0A6M3JLD7_9ZZZZ